MGPRQGRRDALDGQHGDPEGRAGQAPGRALDRVLLRPEERGDHRGIRQLRLPGQGRSRGRCSRSIPSSRTTRSSSRRRTGWRGCTSSATRPPRRKSPGARRSPRQRASSADASGDQLPGRSRRMPCCCRACSSWRSSSSTRRSRCSSSRSGPATSRTASSRRGTGGSTRRRSNEYWPWIAPLDHLRRAGHDPRLRPRVPARLRDRVPRAAPTRTSCCSWSSPRSSRASCCGRCPGRSSSRTTGIFLGPLKTIGIIPADFQLLATPAAVIAGHHLQLPAVHDPAAVRRAREDRSAAPRGGRGPVRRPVATARDDRRPDHRRAARRGGRRRHGLRPDRPGHPRADRRVPSSARGSSARRSSG